MDIQKRNQFLAILGKLHIPVTPNNRLKQNQTSQKLNLSAHSSHKSNHSDKRKTVSKQSKSHQKSDSISHKNAKKQYQESSQKNKQSKKPCKEETLRFTELEKKSKKKRYL